MSEAAGLVVEKKRSSSKTQPVLQKGPTGNGCSDCAHDPDPKEEKIRPQRKENGSSPVGNRAVQRPLQAQSNDLEAGPDAQATVPLANDFSRIPVHPKPKVTLQTKLAVNTAGDIHEQEADRIADQVMRMPNPTKAADELPSSMTSLAQRRVGEGASGLEEAPSSVHEVLSSPGRPLDAATRAFMEPRFGLDFSQVRVHADTMAARSAKDIHAIAYAAGNNLVFASGQFSPKSSAGQTLLAHELTHILQQDGRAQLIQRKPENGNEDDAQIVAKPKSCPGGAIPYNGVCLTDDILNTLPIAEGDVQRAEKIVKANAAEKRAQTRVEEKYAKVSNADLSKKIDQIRDDVKRSDQPTSTPKSLERLEKERERRRALPISPPAKVDQAIAMLEEAWSLAEKEQPPDMRRSAYLVHVVNNWLQKAAPSSGYSEHFSGFSREIAKQTVGYAKGNIDSLEKKFRLHASIGGWWPASITSLKVARELVQIMSGEKRIEETEFHGVSKVINKTAVATPLVGVGIMAAPAVIASGFELIPAGLEMTSAGADAASWAAVRAAPQFASWIGTHPVLAAEIGGAVLNLGEKISEGDLTPQDVGWAVLSLIHADMSDTSTMRPGGPSVPSPTRAPNRAVAALVSGLDNAEVLPRFSAGGMSGVSNRPVPALVASPSPNSDIADTMPTPFRPKADVAPDAPASVIEEEAVGTPAATPVAPTEDVSLPATKPVTKPMRQPSGGGSRGSMGSTSNSITRYQVSTPVVETRKGSMDSFGEPEYWADPKTLAPTQTKRQSATPPKVTGRIQQHPTEGSAFEGISQGDKKVWDELLIKAERPAPRQTTGGYRSSSPARFGNKEVRIIEGPVSEPIPQSESMAGYTRTIKGEHATHAVGMQLGENLPEGITSAAQRFNLSEMKIVENTIRETADAAVAAGAKVETRTVLKIEYLQKGAEEIPVLVGVDREAWVVVPGSDKSIPFVDFKAHLDPVTRNVLVDKNWIRRPERK